MGIKENYKRLRVEIPKEVVIVAVVKGRTLVEIKELISTGATDLGFNTLQQMEEEKNNIPKTVRIHFIGAIQSNKIKKILKGEANLIQSVGTIETAKEINKIAEQMGIKQRILLQINTDLKKKWGVTPESAVETARKIRTEMKNVSLEGLMTIPPEESNLANNEYVTVKRLYDQIGGMKHLSMGMSEDYKIAIKNGANMVRIGRALFY